MCEYTGVLGKSSMFHTRLRDVVFPAGHGRGGAHAQLHEASTPGPGNTTCRLSRTASCKPKVRALQLDSGSVDIYPPSNDPNAFRSTKHPQRELAVTDSHWLAIDMAFLRDMHPYEARTNSDT